MPIQCLVPSFRSLRKPIIYLVARAVQIKVVGSRMHIYFLRREGDLGVESCEKGKSSNYSRCTSKYSSNRSTSAMT